MPNWERLNHAYGTAENVPALLEAIAVFPDESSYEEEPWFSLWSCLYHQGDIYPASFAAVPEIVKRLTADPEKATISFFALPASIEVARAKQGLVVPEELEVEYFHSLAELGRIATAAIGAEKSQEISRAVLAAFAISVKQHGYAEIILEVAGEEVPEVLEWFFDR
ncbi:hypothetical protein [Microbulbifer sediminum]|uniref:hypothetical protein n=1 Tax=Microbulbifer sediminum TaxID=2904250 RepID=UPI001F1E34F2|nr:hypothetical protein [Microbulbifer sediminum]